MTRPTVIVSATGLWLVWQRDQRVVWARRVSLQWLADQLEQERVSRARAAGRVGTTPTGPAEPRELDTDSLRPTPAHSPPAGAGRRGSPLRRLWRRWRM